MKSVILFSYHYYGSRRRAGFHWLADAFHNSGWEVVFVTAPLSWLHRLSGNYRFQYPVIKESNQLIRQRQNFYSYILFSILHPANLRVGWLNRLLKGVLASYQQTSFGFLEDRIVSADMIIFESTPALMLFPRVKALNPEGKLVYRVSDDTSLLDLHPIVFAAEEKAVPHFDLISVPSEYLLNKFCHTNNSRLQYHGINKESFDQQLPSPYESGDNAVYVGNHPHLDWEFLETVAKLIPGLNIHLIGDNIYRMNGRKNVIKHGEMSFRETVPYIKYARMGLHPVNHIHGAEAATDTLKVIQFSYCGLPVIMPEFIHSTRPNVIHYRPGDQQSIEDGIYRALNYKKGKSTDQPNVWTWDELANAIMMAVELN
jgi:2-beta-glucuronyltransferase